MLTRPSHILSPPDISDPDFPAKCIVWTDQMRSEMKQTVAVTKKTLAESRTLLDKVDRIIARI